jgi:hypothetical protein
VYKPTPPYAGACTADQLASVIGDCFDPSTDSQSACDAWEGDSRNSACRGCWSGPIAGTPAATWAPYVFLDNPGQTTYVNVSGCIVLADPSELSCAQTIQNDFACELAACEASCPVPIAGSTTNAVIELENCFKSVDLGGCSMYATGATGATACRETLAANGPSVFCFEAEQGEPQALLAYFTLACGVAPPADSDAETQPDGGPPLADAGVSADTESDAGTDAVSDGGAGIASDGGADAQGAGSADAPSDGSTDAQSDGSTDAQSDAGADAT